MSRAISRSLALASVLTPFLLACGAGTASDPTAVSAAQCSGSSCPPEGAPPVADNSVKLCPDTADIGNSTYLGGAGSGEIVSVNINATAMTYTLTWLESPIPSSPGQVETKRQGVTITGSVAHPPAGFLPTAEQTRCAFILAPGSGAIPGGGTYSTAPTFNPQNPPMILVGQGGVAGGGIPGASIQYDGVSAAAFGMAGTLFPVVQRTFDFYPFIGFASTDTNLADLQGTYNTLAYHIRPSLNWATLGVNAVETFDASGNCSSTTACISTGTAAATNGTGWAPVAGAAYFTSTKVPQLLPPPSFYWTLASFNVVFEAESPGYMVLGKVNGAIVPVVVRTGTADPVADEIDDESGIAILANASAPLTSGGLNGGFAGADSNFKYTATLINGSTGAFINPSTSQAESAFNLTYGGSTQGIATVTDQQNNTGVMVTTGGLVAEVIQGTENGGITPSSSFAGNTTSAPYFGIGALVSK